VGRINLVVSIGGLSKCAGRAYRKCPDRQQANPKL
jgi:hypothetical protein